MTRHENEIYLGDGVYAVFDGTNVTLDLRNQPEINIRDDQNTIVLEPATLHRMLRWLKAVFPELGILR